MAAHPQSRPADGPGDQGAVIAFLSAPHAFGLPSAEPVAKAETHGAIVFLAGGRAYKLKRAVRYPYLDYSTVERRHAACRKELAVNRRMAPQLYLGLAAVVREAGGGLRLIDTDDEPSALDWLVVMRRFGDDDLFEQMRSGGRLTPDLMRTLAETIAAFHDAAERRPVYGGAAAMAEIIGGNIKMLEAMAGDPFAAEDIDRLARLSWAAIDRVGPLLDRRRQEGYVRRCHGDLHLNNICLVDGQPMLFDAIEFEERFASIDVLYDLAFLIMDLERHGLRAYANIVLNRYLERTGDYGGLAALPLFLSCRATISAHVRMTRAHASGRAGAAAPREAGELLHHAIRYLDPPAPQVVAIAGASGTGKSTVARALAPSVGPCPGAVVIRSDVVRKRLMGVEETQRLPASAYTAHASERVFAAMADLAGDVIAAGQAVIVDGVYRQAGERRDIAAVAQRAGVPFTGIWLEAPEATLAARIEGRRSDASDATVEVMREQIAKLERPADWQLCTADRPVEAIVDDLRHRLGLAS